MTDAMSLSPSQILHPETLSLTTVDKVTPFTTYSQVSDSQLNHCCGNVPQWPPQTVMIVFTLPI
jgi:hypothetical protein